MFHDAPPGTVNDAWGMESAARSMESGAWGRTNALLVVHEERRTGGRDARAMAKVRWGTEKDRDELVRDFRGTAGGARGVNDGLPGMHDGAAGAETAPRPM